MKITFIKVTPLIWAIESQNNESFIKVTPLIWAIEGQNNESLIFFLNEAFPQLKLNNTNWHIIVFIMKLIQQINKLTSNSFQQINFKSTSTN